MYFYDKPRFFIDPAFDVSLFHVSSVDRDKEPKESFATIAARERPLHVHQVQKCIPNAKLEKVGQEPRLVQLSRYNYNTNTTDVI